jgi:hypothetical protein
MGLRPRNLTTPRTRQGLRCRYFCELAMELLRCHDHSDTVEFAGVEGLFDFHVPQLLFYSISGESYSSLSVLSSTY